MGAYESGADSQAIEQLEALTQDSDQADLANSLLSGIYLARAKVDASHADALRSIEFGEALGPTARKDLAQFRAYKRAVALDVLGRNDEARKLFAANCSIGAATAQCVLLPEIARSSVDASRHQSEEFYWITSTLPKYGYRSDLITATHLAAMVHLDQAGAQKAYRALAAKGDVPAIVQERYCAALSNLRMTKQNGSAECPGALDH